MAGAVLYYCRTLLVPPSVSVFFFFLPARWFETWLAAHSGINSEINILCTFFVHVYRVPSTVQVG